MKKRMTLFLKLYSILIGLPVLALCSFIVYKLCNNAVSPQYAYMIYPIAAGICLSAIPFYMALNNVVRLLHYIDQDLAFSELSVKALNRIKQYAIVICGLYIVLLPFVYLLADKDDAPGMILMNLIPIFASCGIAVFAALLKILVKENLQ